MRSRQRRDLEEVGAGAGVEREGAERQRIEPLGARGVGGGGGRTGEGRQLRGQVVAGGRSFWVDDGRGLHEPDEFARAQAQGEASFAGGWQWHDPPRQRDFRDLGALAIGVGDGIDIEGEDALEPEGAVEPIIAAVGSLRVISGA